LKQQIKIHAIITSLVFLASLLFGVGGLAYLAGLINSVLLLIVAVITFFPAIGLCVILVVYQFYKAIRVDDTSSNKSRANLIYMSIISAFILLGTFLFYQPWWVCQVRGFFDRMKIIHLERKLPTIRNWLSVIKNADKYPFLVKSTEWPDDIKKLKPRHVWIGQYSYDGTIAVGLTWGGGEIGAWGTVIGPVEMEIPKSHEDEIILPLADGVYVFRSID
jgi:hypothetical protein